MKQTKRIISLILCLLMLVAVVPVMEVSATCCRKDHFDKSRYTLTGDMAYDVAMIAKSQKGRTCTDFGYSGVDYGAWCDEYVADCIENAGGDDSIVAHGGDVADFKKMMRDRGAEPVTSPRTGDLVFFTNGTKLKHVEIVTKVENGVPYCAGGNNGSSPGSCKGERTVGSVASSIGSVDSYLRPNYNNAPAPSSAISIPNGFYTIQSVRDPEKVLDIQGNENKNGANIQLYDNVGTTVQKFWIAKTGDYYTIKNVYTKKWLDIASPYDTDGCNIQLWDTNTRTEQKWRFEDAGNGNVYIHSLYGMYVDTDAGNTYNGVNVETYHFDGSTSQQWTLIKTSGSNKLDDVAEGIYTFHNVRDTSKVLDIQENSTSNGANIQLYDDVNTPVQQFKVQKSGDYYTIQSVHSGKWLDIARPCNENGCNIQLWEKNTEREQKWMFEDAGNGNILIRSLYGMYVDTEDGETNNNTNIETFEYDGSTSQQWRMHRVYNVTYNANGGTGAPGKQYKQANINLTLSSAKPTRSGYTFVKWNTKADGKGTNYNSGAYYTGNADLTLYAVWNHTTHAYTAKVTKAATCTTDGVRTYTCSCGASYTETIAKLGHSYGAWTKLNDTQHQRVCSRNSSHVEKANHTWNAGTVTKAATCVATGVKTYTCTVCKATKTETIAVNASNHMNKTNVAATASTCTVKGYTAGVYCNDCKKYISGHAEQPLAAHKTTTQNAKAASCTAEGYTGDQVCTVCKQTITKGTAIAKKAHTLTTVNKAEASCTAAGYTGDQYCTTCKQTITKGSAINALGHANADSNGNCTRCGQHIKDVTPSQPSNPQPNPNACKYCGKVHTGPFGWLIKFFHSILAIFKR